MNRIHIQWEMGSGQLAFHQELNIQQNKSTNRLDE